MAEMNKWNWVEINNLVKDMTRIYRRHGHDVMRVEFVQVLTLKGARYSAKCRACERRLNFVIAMGLGEPKGVKATAIDYCPKRPTAGGGRSGQVERGGAGGDQGGTAGDGGEAGAVRRMR